MRKDHATRTASFRVMTIQLKSVLVLPVFNNTPFVFPRFLVVVVAFGAQTRMLRNKHCVDLTPDKQTGLTCLFTIFHFLFYLMVVFVCKDTSVVYVYEIHYNQSAWSRI